MIKGTYRLEEKIGNSHLGEIYLGTRDGGEPVTVEILAGSMTSDEETVTRFLQEVEILSSLRHPSLLAAIEAGQDTDTYFLVTAYEHGMVSLNEYLAQHKALEPAQALGFMESIAGRSRIHLVGGKNSSPGHQASEYLHHRRRAG